MERRYAYEVSPTGEFIVHNYNWAKNFHNFFPGIAGKLGIPMWVYYVSKAQAICSMGVRDKDNPIMEFLSFNKAIEVVGLQGFRTFVKLSDDTIYEPFKKNSDDAIKQKMTISAYDLRLTEINENLKLKFDVLYYPIVNESFPAFVRRLVIENIGNDDMAFELIDGLPKLLPAGVDLHCVQVISRHIEGMMKVDLVDNLPAYRLKQTPADVEKVAEIKECNYYFSFSNQQSSPQDQFYIADPYIVFGENENYDFPWNFKYTPYNELLRMPQILRNRTPSAFTLNRTVLKPGQKYEMYSVIGRAASDFELKKIAKKVADFAYLERKALENKAVIEAIKDLSLTVSKEPFFDEYCEQTFLDNVIRGGMPEVFPTKDGKTAFYVYSRQNGDLERDYHYFVLEPAYYSQGNGHYRSVNQNRRSDVLFFPEIEDENIRTFVNLIQLDGYNPLTVTILTYSLVDTVGAKEWLKKLLKDDNLVDQALDLLSKPFTPGAFLLFLEKHGVEIRSSYRDILKQLLSFAVENENGDIHEGYWIDHWFYNLDLIDNFLAVYPDKIRQLFFENRRYYFYDDPDIVQPRDKKYVLVDGKVRQYDAVLRDEKKMELINSRTQFPKRMRTKHGAGDVYYTNLFTKMLTIVVNRVATLDPDGIGIEMEANKPGWNDSMNGLPGIFGSSLGETAELERALRLLLKSLQDAGYSDSEEISLFAELAEFINALNTAIVKRLAAKQPEAAFVFWDESHSIKEDYIEKTKYGILGEEKRITVGELRQFLNNALNLVSSVFSEENFDKVCNEDGVPYTYFYHEVVEYELTGEKNVSGYPTVRPKKIVKKPIPLFLEGPMHIMKVHPEYAARIYDAVKRSNVYDKKLKMYKVCESLESAPFEIGRVKAWGSGWIENESVYTHMEYKYMLEILRSGLYDRFFEDVKTVFMPFLSPYTYGRSIFENVSFIVSSAFPDEKMHGQGLQPRLSGVTGEMISMWLIMTVGERPFVMENGELILRFEPHLPGWLFTAEPRNIVIYAEDGSSQTVTVPANSFAFKFLGSTLVVYHNARRLNTYGPDGVKIVRYKITFNDDTSTEIDGEYIPSEYAVRIRKREAKRIDVFLS